MTQASAANVGREKDTGLLWRDWILLPILSLLTVCLFAGSAELISRRIFFRLPTSGESCLRIEDSLSGARGIPNCVVSEKMPEGKLTEYRFNSNGYRNYVDFGPKPSGTYRIVLVGTSVAAGFRVAQEQTIAGLLPQELSQRTGRKVEVYSAGLPWRSASAISRDLKDAIATNPDMILWILSPLDVTYASSLRNANEQEPLNLPAGAGQLMREWYLAKSVFTKQSFVASITTVFSHTASATMLRDLFYRSPSQYVQASLAGADYKKEFLQNEPRAGWYEELREFDASAASIERQATKAGIPLVAVLVPDRTQATMISMMSYCPKGFDPYKLGNELRSIVESHGGTYVDILPEFRTISNPQLGYFALDGHPNAFGYAMITKFLTNKLAGITIPTLNKAAAQPPAESKQ
jgi:hypothetical protein